jgi:hypothetical protein
MSDTPELALIHRHWMGLKITAIRFPDGRMIRAGAQMPHPESGYCKSITAYSEPGDRSFTIWFDLKMSWTQDFRVNSAHVERVEYVTTHEAGE